MRAGEVIRVNTQLVEAPGGSVLWSHTAQATLRDVFQLQDDLVQRIVASLSLPLTAREHQLLKHDMPASSTAYEFYLRGNQMLQQANVGLLEPAKLARDLYLHSVEDDSQYAPAWANLGRCYRVLGKAGSEDAGENLIRAESCLQRALALNPHLASATRAYAQLESDLGRSRDGLVRLIACGHANDADPELWAGLVHACRYCGLLEASVAAMNARGDSTLRSRRASGIRTGSWVTRRARFRDADGFTSRRWSLPRPAGQQRRSRPCLKTNRRTDQS
jgi:tetratricopeptide (TPR) repeat protein